MNQITKLQFLQQRKIKILSKIEKTLLNSLINFQTKDKIKLSELISISKCSIDPQNTPKTLYMEYSMPAYDSNKKPNKVYGVAMHSTRLKINEPVILFNKLNVRKKRIWNIKKVPQNSVSSAEFIPLKAQTIYQDYLYYALNTDYVLYKAISLSTGSSNSQKRIVPKDLLTMKIPVPNIQQQKNIASLLDRYDSEIKNYKKKVVFLVKLKKFLLQNIFI
ncbi:restriction endonuclease subunit S [Lactobacillus kefiranofaciens]|uniref:restriction endonuclease subunit S n=1 Tax=Lactobacillus kefiranofaciens TaxID=267818 RepID=UPI00159FA1AB|nr:restriction endonuclease subunit S [Lactobacillus kefiranofaciens]WQH36287.1 restriction endonuclease subunit S [Lactobacillus kefiranofaciens]